MELYRAMSPAELQETLRIQRPAFRQRYKWFSPDLNFIRNRVMDGEFNNSRFRPERYVKLVKFVITPESARFFRHGQKEWMLDRRFSHLVSWISFEAISPMS